MASLSDLPKLGDMAGHPFQTNPQTDTSKVTKADNPTGTSVVRGEIQAQAMAQRHLVTNEVSHTFQVTVNAKKHEELPPMKAVCWYGKRDVRVVDRPRPAITDSKGDILGHEFMGVVDEVGPDVKNHKKGDRVVVCFDIACGSCAYCHKGLHSSCSTTNPSGDQEALYGLKSGGFFGYSHLTGGYEGGQAEYVRVPMADVNCLAVPEGMPDEKVILLSDILGTAWHANEMGEVGPGKNVAIWGAGPVGILAAHCAFERGAGRVILIDKEVYRLEYAAKKVPGVETLDYSKKKVDAELRAMFGDLQGPDVCIEAVGFHYAKTMLHMIEQKLMLETDPADVLNELIRCCRKGGVISIVGVYAGFTNHFNIGAFMEKALTMRGGQTPVQKYWHLLLKK
ncbi:hypothetical protein QJQ45_029180, partial [Haematococcus lacustris]